ncbi:hypothetical protein [Pararhizobium gei]|uniref:hypothetical protein n=1 Tax=Pararhizobium gei TaxID=1395951 RepID=UPI0023DA5F9F|nr:hypothetical protein [Rhizobium gei]
MEKAALAAFFVPSHTEMLYRAIAAICGKFIAYDRYKDIFMSLCACFLQAKSVTPSKPFTERDFPHARKLPVYE